MAGLDVVTIPYKGTSQSLPDLVAGRVAYTIDNLGPILPFIRSGQFIALGVSTKEPVSLLPGVPPIDSVLKGYELSSWNMLAMPANTPKDIVEIGQRGVRPHYSAVRRGREDAILRLRAGRRHA